MHRASSRHKKTGDLPSGCGCETDDGEVECRDGHVVESENRVILREMNGCIRGVVDTLPGGYSPVTILIEIEGLKDGEIAEVLGISLQVAKVRLRQELEKTCLFSHDERNELACDRK